MFSYDFEEPVRLQPHVQKDVTGRGTVRPRFAPPGQADHRPIPHTWGYVHFDHLGAADHTRSAAYWADLPVFRPSSITFGAGFGGVELNGTRPSAMRLFEGEYD